MIDITRQFSGRESEIRVQVCSGFWPPWQKLANKLKFLPWKKLDSFKMKLS